VIIAGGIVWFDYLNVIDAKTLLAPLYHFIGREGRTQAKLPSEDDLLNMDAERLSVILETLKLREEELVKQEQDLQNRRKGIEQMAQELEERQKALDEREKSLNDLAGERENRDKNVEQNARYLTGMEPDRAVGIIAAMDDQDAIDVFRKTEAISAAEGTASMVSYWLSHLPPERAAALQRKMAGRP
jgi:flagellar protein FlbB